jgi:hypothetical protein
MFWEERFTQGGAKFFVNHRVGGERKALQHPGQD